MAPVPFMFGAYSSPILLRNEPDQIMAFIMDALVETGVMIRGRHPNEAPVDTSLCSCYTRYRFNVPEEMLQFWGYTSLAFAILILSALCAGLTLAIFSLDMTRLHILSASQCVKEKEKAKALARIRRRSSWFLCAMIICSVTMSESLPMIIQLLFGNSWVPIVISTVMLGILAELLPQYLIPRYALDWGYYCSPLIWGAMWLTSILSFPIAFLLDHIIGAPQGHDMYTHDQLSMLIKFHEQSEKRGGYIGADCGRVVRGALALDGKQLAPRLPSNPSTVDEGGILARDPDAERGCDLEAGIITKWSSVKYIHINDEVTKELIQHIKSCSYSRIPVVGNGELACEELDNIHDCRGAPTVYGFLHIKNLVGLELSDEDGNPKKLYIKDLPLYPLPIVRDDIPMYDLLNMFQIGLARMAIVIPAPFKDKNVPLCTATAIKDALPRNKAPLWSKKNGLSTRDNIEMIALNAQVEWTTDLLEAVQQDRELRVSHRKQSVIGVDCPRPIGIVTFEDLIDTLLQKTSRDEKDFFDRNNATPVTKSRKVGDSSEHRSSIRFIRTRKVTPAFVTKVRGAFERSETSGSLRRRHVSANTNDNEGGSDIVGFDGPNDLVSPPRMIAGQRMQLDDHSSYTLNSNGGFHDAYSSIESRNSLPPRELEESKLDEKVYKKITDGHPLSCYSRNKSRTVVETLFRDSSIDEPTTTIQKTKQGALSKLQIGASPSNYSLSNYPVDYSELSRIDLRNSLRAASASSSGTLGVRRIEKPTALSIRHRFRCNENNYTGHTTSISSWDTEHVSTLASEDFSTNALIETHKRRSLEDENIAPSYSLETLASMRKRRSKSGDMTGVKTGHGGSHARDHSFHDDRAFLPSQKCLGTPLEERRRTSIWF